MPKSACTMSPAALAETTAYINRFAPLVQAELNEEQQQVEERLRQWPLGRLRAEGLVLLGLSGSKRGNYFGKTILVMREDRGGELPFHRFGSGDLVTLSRNNPLTERCTEAIVLDKSRFEVRVVVDRLPPGLSSGTWRVDRGVNLVAYQRAAAALRSLYKRPSAPAAVSAVGAGHDAAANDGASSLGYDEEEEGQEEPQEQYGGEGWPHGSNHQGGRGGGYGGHRGGRARGRGRRDGGGHRAKRPCRQADEDEEDEDVPVGTYIWDVLVGRSPAAAAAPASGVMPPQALAWAQSVLSSPRPAAGEDEGAALKEEDTALGLNRSQLASVAMALQHRVALMQGPPGTGKTATIIRLLHLLRRQLGLRVPILACAQSNVAVDNMLEGLVDLGIRAVRVGQPVKVREGLRGATLDARLEVHPLQQDIGDKMEQYWGLRRRLPSLRGRDRGLGHRDVSVLRRQVKELRVQMAQQVLAEAEVVCATCIGAGGEQLQDMQFPLVVLDEGSQCSEPESLIPLVKASAHVVLVGDQCQLPPVVQSAEAARGGLSTSLFARLLEAGVPSAMLQVQYRMHPSLSAFPNREFYSGRLVDGVRAADRPPPQGFAFPNPDMQVVFMDLPHGQEAVTQGGSKSNEVEAKAVADLVHLLVHHLKQPPGSIGLVTPYVAQVQLLSSKLRDLVPVCPQLGISTAASDSTEVEIKSVDGYQGREKDIIIFSCVRANSSASVGFLEDWRRMNVAITRAKAALFIVGNRATLHAGDEHWRRYIDWLEKQRCVLSGRDVDYVLRKAKSRRT